MNLSAALVRWLEQGFTLMSVRLGQKDYSTANRILGNVFVLNVIFGLAFMIVRWFLGSDLRFFGRVLPRCLMRMIICWLFIGYVLPTFTWGKRHIALVGMPQKAMYATLISVVLNAVLTPIFIFTFKWGIKGSALATVISQIIMLGWQISCSATKIILSFAERDF